MDTRIVRYDRDARHVTASVVVHDTAFDGEDARLNLHLEWDPTSEVPHASGSIEGDAAVLDDAGSVQGSEGDGVELDAGSPEQ